MATWTEHIFAFNPDTFDIRRRSKHGCIDCKAAKVRCDEVRPSCGTCTRRRRGCRGYAHDHAHAKPLLDKKQQRSGFNNQPDIMTESHIDQSTANIGSEDCMLPTVASTSEEAQGREPLHLQASTGAVLSRSSSQNTASSYQTSRDLVMETSPCDSTTSLPHIPQFLRAISLGAIPEADGPTINVYFNRHPLELVISPEFVDEMNAAVLLVLQDNPAAIGDALYLIGCVYLDEDGQDSLLPLALVRRARTLARLRVKDPSRELEQMLVMTLALSAMELIDTKCKAHERTFPIIIEYAARIINKYAALGLLLGSLAKYFIRTLARQDMMISLSQCRRNSIRTELWLDETARISADRFMGYTATLMPLLQELCALAEDVRQNTEVLAITDGLEGAKSTSWSVTRSSTISQTMIDLRFRLQSWRPTLGQGVSAQAVRRLLTQAYASRAAALLMLHRLIQPTGSSAEGDQEAFHMACEIIVYLNGEPYDLRLSTWPAFIASCELQSQEDRTLAVEIFNRIYSSRKTGTAIQTRNFITQRVWKARDEGKEWNWMVLSRKYPGECMPI